MWSGSLLRSVGITVKEHDLSTGGTVTWLKWRSGSWFPNSGRRAEREKKDTKSVQN